MRALTVFTRSRARAHTHSTLYKQFCIEMDKNKSEIVKCVFVCASECVNSWECSSAIFDHWQILMGFIFFTITELI